MIEHLPIELICLIGEQDRFVHGPLSLSVPEYGLDIREKYFKELFSFSEIYVLAGKLLYMNWKGVYFDPIPNWRWSLEKLRDTWDRTKEEFRDVSADT